MLIPPYRISAMPISYNSIYEYIDIANCCKQLAKLTCLQGQIKTNMTLSLDGFENIGEKTYVKSHKDKMVIFQRIKLHLVITTILIGLLLTAWFRFYPTLLISLIGLLEIFCSIRVTINRHTQVLVKDLHFFNWKVFHLYSLNNLDKHELIKYESGRGESATVTSLDIGYVVKDKTKELLTFGKASTQDHLFKAVSEFMQTKANSLQQNV